MTLTVTLIGARVVGRAARARQDLARWRVEQGRAAEAQDYVEHARATYVEIGAHGWLERLDAEFSSAVADQR